MYSTMPNVVQVDVSSMRISHGAKGRCNATMKRAAIRLANLRALVKETETAAELARRCDVDRVYLSQIISGQKTPKGTVRGVGDKLAESLERGMDKPSGWLDIDHSAQRPSPKNETDLSIDEKDLVDAWRAWGEHSTIRDHIRLLMRDSALESDPSLKQFNNTDRGFQKHVDSHIESVQKRLRKPKTEKPR